MISTMLIKDSKKVSFSFFSFIFWFALATIFPAIGGNFSIFQLAHLFIYFIAAYYTGELCISSVGYINLMPPLLFTGTSIIIGSLINGLFFLILPNKFLTYLISSGFVLNIFMRKRINLNFSFKILLCIAPLFLLLFQSYELEYAMKERYNHSDGDYSYYTALVESIKSTHSIFDAVFHKGIPINYSPMPFIPPAHMASFANIQSQFALWGMFLKIVPILAFSVMAYCITRIYYIVFDIPGTEKTFEKHFFLSVLMLMFLGPLHFINLLKFDLSNVLFLGIGYLLPTGSPGFALSIFLSGLILLLVIPKISFSVSEKILLVALFCLTVASKIAMFVPLTLMIGIIGLYRWYNGSRHLLIILLISIPLCFLIYKITIGAADSIIVTRLTTDGYFQSNFFELATKYGINKSKGIKILIMFFINVSIWIGMKFFLIGFAGYKQRSNKKAVILISSLLICLCLSFLPGFFIDVYGVSASGKKLFDIKIDMAQFARASVFLFTSMAIVFILYIFENITQRRIRSIVRVGVSAWMILIAVSFLLSSFTLPKKVDQSWYLQVRKDFRIANPHLMAMMGNYNFSGQTLTTAGVHPWYCTGIRENAEGYIFSKKAYSRYNLLTTAFDPLVNIARRKEAFDSLRHLGIDAIVASPWSQQKFDIAVKDSLIVLIPKTKWIYEFK